MAWLMITARFKVSGIVLLTILVNLSHQLEQPIHVSNQNHHGTCASIGYSTKCCPPGESCEASDGNCKCSASCRSQYFNNCCEDVFCHPSNNNVYHIIIIITTNNWYLADPKTCQDVGCCNSESGCVSKNFQDENGHEIPCNGISNCRKFELPWSCMIQY